MKQQRRRDVVRQVAEDPHRSPPPERPHVEIQRVTVHDAQPVLARESRAAGNPPAAGPFPARVSRAPVSRAAPVSAPRPGPISTSSSPGLHVELRDDPPGEVLVVQEILPERLRRRELQLRQARRGWRKASRFTSARSELWQRFAAAVEQVENRPGPAAVNAGTSRLASATTDPFNVISQRRPADA